MHIIFFLSVCDESFKQCTFSVLYSLQSNKKVWHFLPPSWMPLERALVVFSTIVGVFNGNYVLLLAILAAFSTRLNIKLVYSATENVWYC